MQGSYIQILLIDVMFTCLKADIQCGNNHVKNENNRHRRLTL